MRTKSILKYVLFKWTYSRTNSKKWLNKGERSDAYPTHVCRLPWCIERLERIDNKSELSASTMAAYTGVITLMFYIFFPPECNSSLRARACELTAVQKSIATQITQDVGLAQTPYTGQEFLPTRIEPVQQQALNSLTTGLGLTFL